MALVIVFTSAICVLNGNNRNKNGPHQVVSEYPKPKVKR